MLLEVSEALATLDVPNKLIECFGAQFELIIFGHWERLSPEDLGFSVQSNAAGVRENEKPTQDELMDGVIGDTLNQDDSIAPDCH